MILEVRNLNKTFLSGAEPLHVLRNLNLGFPAGQFAAIMGASGSGKSTLLGLMAGLDSPTSGAILLEGQDITGLAESDLALLRGRKIGYVFQSFQLIPTLTAEENVLLPHELVLGGSATGPARERARSLLAQVGLGARGGHYPIQLSGGEQQRVALARAFMVRPPLILADEPTGNLDRSTGQQILRLLLQLNQGDGARAGATLILVTHDPVLAAHADRIIELEDGQLISDRMQMRPAHA